MLPFLIISRLMKLLPTECKVLPGKSILDPRRLLGQFALASVSEAPGNAVVNHCFGLEIRFVIESLKLH